jgi:hypothetical protein
MRWKSVILIMSTTALSGIDYTRISTCNKSLPTWAYDQGECAKKTIQYSSRVFSDTSMNYDLRKNNTSEIVSMGAQYSHELFSAKLQGSYIKNRFDNTPSVGKTNLLVQYRQKLWDSLSLNASENVYIPLKTANDQSDPMKYTSLLNALYPVNDVYNVFAEGSYSLLDTSASENTIYRNPYSYTTGITYTDDTDTAINASYMLTQDVYPTLGPNKKIKLAHKHKISKKIKTSVSVSKSLETDIPDNKATFDLIYTY